MHRLFPCSCLRQLEVQYCALEPSSMHVLSTMAQLTELHLTGGGLDDAPGLLCICT